MITFTNINVLLLTNQYFSLMIYYLKYVYTMHTSIIISHVSKNEIHAYLVCTYENGESFMYFVTTDGLVNEPDVVIFLSIALFG